MKFLLAQKYKDWDRLPLVMLAFGLVAFLFSYVFDKNAFPSATIEFKYPRQQIEAIAKKFATERSFDLKDATTATVFDQDSDTKTFLEYKLGLKRADELMKQTNCVFYWDTRFFRSMDKHDLTVQLSPDGQLTAFEERFPNDEAKRVHLTHDRAEAMARKFISENAREDLKSYELISETESELGTDYDFNFVWRQLRSDLQGGGIELQVSVRGTQICKFDHYIKPPPGWDEEYKRLRSGNATLLSTVKGIYYALYVVAGLIFLYTLNEGQLRWRYAMFGGILFGLFYVLSGFNSLAQYAHGYTGDVPLDEYMNSRMLNCVFDGLILGFLTFCLVGAGERVYRFCYPRKQALESILHWREIRRRGIAVSIAAGYALCGLGLGWVVFYYVAGSHVGIYTPLNDYSVETISSSFPAISAIFIGIMASIHEEFLYRVLGLSLAQKVVKNFWVANLIQASAWAFMHSDYAQEPPWARGVELTVDGCVAGLVMRRYGLLACICAHYVYDTFLGVAPLFSSDSLSWKFQAIVAVIPFALIALLGWRYGGDRVAVLTNRSITLVQNLSSQARGVRIELPFTYTPMRLVHRVVILLIIAVSCAIQRNAHRDLLGSYLQLDATRSQVVETSKRYLSAHDIDITSSVVSVSLDKNFSENELVFLFDTLTNEKLRQYFVMPGKPMTWQATFDLPKKKTKYIVEVNYKGVAQAVEIFYPEAQPGAKLNREQAEKLLRKFIQDEHPELTPYKLDSVERTEREHRTDYQFTIVVPKFKAGDAEYRTRIGVTGDQVSGFWYWWELPDRWNTKRAIEKSHSILASFFNYAALTLVFGAIIWWCVGMARNGIIPWRDSAIAALFLAVPFAMQVLNGLPGFFSKYDVNTPLDTYIYRGIADDAASVGQAYLGFFVASALALGSMYQLGYGTSLTNLLRTLFLPKLDQLKASRALWVDGLLIGYAVGASISAFSRLLGATEPTRTTLTESFDRLCALATGLNVAMNTFSAAAILGFSIVLGFAICTGLFQKRLTVRIFAVLFAAFVAFSAEQKGEAIGMFIGVGLFTLFLCSFSKFVVTHFSRNNILAYFFAGYSSWVLWDLQVLQAHAAREYSADKFFLWVTLILPVLYAVAISLIAITRLKTQPETELIGNNPESNTDQ